MRLKRSKTLLIWLRSSKPPDIETREHIYPWFGSQVYFSDITDLDMKAIVLEEEWGDDFIADQATATLVSAMLLVVLYQQLQATDKVVTIVFLAMIMHYGCHVFY